MNLLNQSRMDKVSLNVHDICYNRKIKWNTLNLQVYRVRYNYKLWLLVAILWCILLIYTCSIWSKMKNNYTPLPKPLITTITSSLDSIFNLIKTMVIKLIYMFSAHFQIMPKFDNMVLSDLVLFKDGMYFIYSLTETLSNYRDYRINKKQFLVHHVN